MCHWHIQPSPNICFKTSFFPLRAPQRRALIHIRSHHLLPDLHCFSSVTGRYICFWSSPSFQTPPCYFAVFSQLHHLSHLTSLVTAQLPPPIPSHASLGLKSTADRGPFQHWFLSSNDSWSPTTVTLGWPYTGYTISEEVLSEKILLCHRTKHKFRNISLRNRKIQRVCMIATQSQQKPASEKSQSCNSPLTLTKEKTA